MKQRTYIDTSVIGGVFDPEFEIWSKRLLEEFRSGIRRMVLSDLTLRELENAPTNVRGLLDSVPSENKEMVLLDQEAETLADRYIAEGGVPERFRLDAQHIAIATISRADVLVSWNFKHIVNLRRIRIYNAINIKHGYHMMEIRSPREVLQDEEEV